jgi:hypothetical protein
LFKEAIKIDPQNLNLQMDLASTYRRLHSLYSQ